MASAARIGFDDLAAIYTVRTWVFGWFARLVTQVIFFSLFGLLLGSIVLERYRVIGNSAALAAIEGMSVVITVVAERQEGTLGMQVLAPSPFALTYLARGAWAFIVGTGSSTGAFIIAALVFRLPVVMPEALLTPLVMAVMAVTSYCFGLMLGAVVMGRPSLQWLALNAGYLSVMTIAGVNVPVAYWPRPVQIIANGLPLTHGLRAFRLLLSGGPYPAVFADLAAEAVVGAAWLAVAVCVLNLAVHAGRRNGTLELSA
jgi:ABC-2 type transport system permease protein